MKNALAEKLDNVLKNFSVIIQEFHLKVPGLYHVRLQKRKYEKFINQNAIGLPRNAGTAPNGITNKLTSRSATASDRRK